MLYKVYGDKPRVIFRPLWRDKACAEAYCAMLNKAFPNDFFGITKVADEEIQTTKDSKKTISYT